MLCCLERCSRDVQKVGEGSCWFVGGTNGEGEGRMVVGTVGGGWR